ncbi:hypothetical protein H5410_045479, partial [Solanum commersonii]
DNCFSRQSSRSILTKLGRSSILFSINNQPLSGDKRRDFTSSLRGGSNNERFVSFVMQNISMKRSLGHFVADMNITPTASSTGC